MIGFGPGVPWAAMSQYDARAKARNPIYPRAYRVYFAAWGWGNRIGHAELPEGHLAAILAGEDGKPLLKQAVNKAIGAARDLDLIAPESGVRCLVLPAYHFQKDGQGSGSCRIHGIRVSK